MKKILFLIHTLGGGGAERVLVNLVNNMSKEDYEVTVMTVIDTGIFRKDLDPSVRYKTIVTNPFSKGVDKNKPGNLLSKPNPMLKLLAKMYVYMWRCVPTKLLYKVFIRDVYDVEVAFLEGICAKLISASSNKNSKKIGWIHVDLLNHPKSSGVFRSLLEEKKCYEKFDQLIAVSECVKESVEQKFEFNKDKVTVRYNPINEYEVMEKSKDLVTDMVKKNNFVFCSIGRLITQKGFDRLLRVYNELIKTHPECELWIIGEGGKRAELEEYIQNNSLQDRVKLVGFKSNPYKYLRLADAFVCSSRAEGFSTVASEAVVLGKPIVTVNCSGMTELLGKNNEYGIVTDNNEEALLEGMKQLMDPNVFEMYSHKIKERSEFFSQDRAIKRIEELF